MIVDPKMKTGFVGAYLIDGALEGSKLGITKKPTKIRIFLIRMVLGWKWASLQDLKKKDGD